jgi:diguanylate cyclase (GGDEF)-like protein
MRAFDRRRGEPNAPHRPSTDATRLSALWRISTATAGGENEALDAMLAGGAASMRPGQPFVARLGRVDDGDLVVEAAAGAYFEAPAHDLLALGARIPFADGPEHEVVADGRTHAWDDVRGAGWRALIATPFRVGSIQYVLSFVSPQPMERPFAPDDQAYIEILAGYIERGLQQRWQAERLRFQMQHDPLTGLSNRSQFRALVGNTLDEVGACGLAVVEIADLRNVNERLGHQTGDALLVEVGAALAEHNRDGEFTGRLYGGSFGICFPRVESRVTLIRRVAEYAELFRTPFSTGDREGIDWVDLSASFGTALAPADAHTADDLFAVAESAIAPFPKTEPNEYFR